MHKEPISLGMHNSLAVSRVQGMAAQQPCHRLMKVRWGRNLLMMRFINHGIKRFSTTHRIVCTSQT